MKSFRYKIITATNSVAPTCMRYVEHLSIKEQCKNCGYFNKSITDPNLRFRCNVTGYCIEATLNENVVSKIWNKYEETELLYSMNSKLSETEQLVSTSDRYSTVDVVVNQNVQQLRNIQMSKFKIL
jgi:hypothetical protein